LESGVTARPYIGGQAILEGVMMRAPRAVAMAVRRPDGSLAIQSQPYAPITDRLPFLKLPFLRGGVIMVESMVLGMRALTWSAEQAGLEEAKGPPSTKDKLAIAGTLVTSILLGLGFFVALPHLLTAGLGAATGLPLDADQPLFHLVDGVIKALLFVGYLGAIGQMKDIQRVFQYHGAEHMSIYAWESGQELTVENVRAWTRFHPRCGTSFLLFVVLASIAVFTPFFALIPPIPVENGAVKSLIQVAIKLPLMVPVAGLSYELIRLSSRTYRFALSRWISVPGMWLQRLTTREPDDAQLEVAIASLQAAWAAHASQGVEDLGLEGKAFQTGGAALAR
jgi:uncharacterized protein YqhQ